jgi:hypothetical protein
MRGELLAVIPNSDKVGRLFAEDGVVELPFHADLRQAGRGSRRPFMTVDQNDVLVDWFDDFVKDYVLRRREDGKLRRSRQCATLNQGHTFARLLRFEGFGVGRIGGDVRGGRVFFK